MRTTRPVQPCRGAESKWTILRIRSVDGICNGVADIVEFAGIAITAEEEDVAGIRCSAEGRGFDERTVVEVAVENLDWWGVGWDGVAV